MKQPLDAHGCGVNVMNLSRFQLSKHSYHTSSSATNVINTDLVNLQRITEKQNKVVITDRMWARLLSSTNQPSFLTSRDVVEDKKEEEAINQISQLKNNTEDETVSNPSVK